MGKMTLQEAKNKIDNLKSSLNSYINGDGIKLFSDTSVIQKEIFELCELKKIVDLNVEEFEYNEVTQKADVRSRTIGDTILPYSSLNGVIKDILGQKKAEYDSVSRINELVDYYNKEGVPGDYKAKVFYEEHLPFGEGNLNEKEEFVNLYRTNEAIRFANPSKAKTMDELMTLFIEGRDKESIKEKRKQAKLEQELNHNPLENAPSRDYGVNVNKYNIDLTKDTNVEHIKFEKAKVLLNDNTVEAVDFQREFYVEMLNKMLDLPDHKLALSNSNEADKYYEDHIKEINMLFSLEELFGGPNFDGGLRKDFELDDDIIDVLKHKSELAKTYIAKSKNNIKMRSNDPISFELLDSLSPEERELALNNMMILPNRVKMNRLEYLESKKNIADEINDLPKPSYSMDGYHINPRKVFTTIDRTNLPTLDDKINALNNINLSRNMNRKIAEFKNAILTCNENIKREDINNNQIIESYLELKTAATLFSNSLTNKELSSQEGQDLVNYINDLKGFIDKSNSYLEMKSNVSIYENAGKLNRTKMDDILEACELGRNVETYLDSVNFNSNVSNDEKRELKNTVRSLAGKLSDIQLMQSAYASNFGKKNVSVGIRDTFIPGIMTMLQEYKNYPNNLLLDKISPNSSVHKNLTKIYSLLNGVKDLTADELTTSLKDHSTKTFFNNIGNIKHDLKELGYKQNVTDEVLVEKLKESFEKHKSSDFYKTYNDAMLEVAYENRTIGEEIEYQESILRRYMENDIPFDKRIPVENAVAKIAILKGQDKNAKLIDSAELDNSVKDYLKNHLNVVNNIQINGSDAIKEYFNNPESINGFEFETKELPEPNILEAYRELREKMGVSVDVSNLPEDFVPKELSQVQKDARIYLENTKHIEIKSKIVDQVGPLFGEVPGNFDRLYTYLLKTPYTKEDVLYNNEVIKNLYENKVDDNGVPFRKKILQEKLNELKNLNPNELIGISDEDLVKNFEKLRTTWGLAFAGKKDFVEACISQGIELSNEDLINIDILNDQATFAFTPLEKRMIALGNPYWEIGTMLNEEQLQLEETLKIKHAPTLLKDVNEAKAYIDVADERSNIQKAFSDSGINNIKNEKNIRLEVYDSDGNPTSKPINEVYGALLSGQAFSIKVSGKTECYQYNKKHHGLVKAGSFDGLDFKQREIDTTLHLENREYRKDEYLDTLKKLRDAAQSKVVFCTFFTKEDMARVLVLDDIILKLNNAYNDPNADLYFKSYANEDFIQDSVNRLVREERFNNFVKGYIKSDNIPENIAIYIDKPYFGFDTETGEFFTASEKKEQEDRTRKYDVEIYTREGQEHSSPEAIDALYTAHSELTDKIINLRKPSKSDIARLIVYESLKEEIKNSEENDILYDQVISKVTEEEVNRRMTQLVETDEFNSLIDRLGGVTEGSIFNRPLSKDDTLSVYSTYHDIKNMYSLRKCENVLTSREDEIKEFNGLTDEGKLARFQENSEEVYNFKLAADLKLLRESNNPEEFLSNAGKHMLPNYKENYKKDLRELWETNNNGYNINFWNERLTEESTQREIDNIKAKIRVNAGELSSVAGPLEFDSRMNLFKIGLLKDNLKNNLGYSLKEIEDLAYKYSYDDNYRMLRRSVVENSLIARASRQIIGEDVDGWTDRIPGLLEYYRKKEKGEIQTPQEYLNELKKTEIVSLEEEKEFLNLCAINNSVRFANPSKVKSYDEIWNVQHDLELQNLHKESVEYVKRMDDAKIKDYKVKTKHCFSRSYEFNFDNSLPITERIKMERGKMLLNGNTKEALEFQREFLTEIINKVISIPDEKLALDDSKEAKEFLVNNWRDFYLLFEIEHIIAASKNDFEIPKDIMDVIIHKKNLVQEHLQETEASVKLYAREEYRVAQLFGDVSIDELRIATSGKGEFLPAPGVNNSIAFLQSIFHAKSGEDEKVQINYAMDNHYLNSKDVRIKAIPTPERTIKELNSRFNAEIDKVELGLNDSFNEFKEALKISSRTILLAESLEENKFIYDNLLKKADTYLNSMHGQANVTADETNAINFAKEVKKLCDDKSKLFANKIEVARIEKEFGAETNVIDRILNAGQNGYQLERDANRLNDADPNLHINASVLTLLRDANVICNNAALNDELVFGKNNIACFKNNAIAGYLLGLHNTAKLININELNKLKANPELYDAAKKIYDNAMKLPDNIEGINLLIENRSRLSILENLPRIKDEFKKYGYTKEISDSDLVDLVQDKLKSYAAIDSPIEKSVKEIVYSDRTVKEELEFRRNRIRTFGNRELKENEWAGLTRDIAFVLRYKDEMDGPLGGLNNMEENITSYLVNHKELMVNMLNHDKETIVKAIDDPTKLLEVAVLKENVKELPDISQNYQIALDFLRENGVNTDNMNQEYTDVPFDDFKKDIIKMESKYEGLDPSKGNVLTHEIENMIGKTCPLSFGRVTYHLLKPITSKENLKYDIDMIHNIATNPIGNNGVPFRKQILLDTLEKVKGIDFDKYVNISNEDMLKNIEEIKGLGGLALTATGTFKTACEKEGIQFTNEDIQELGIIESKAMSLLGPLKEVLVVKGSPNEYIFDQLNLSTEQLERVEGEPPFEERFFMNSLRAKQEKGRYDEFSKVLFEIGKCDIEYIPNKAECKVKVYENGASEEIDFAKGYNKLNDGKIISVSEKIENPLEAQEGQEPAYKEPVFYKYDSKFGAVIKANSIEEINKQADSINLGKFNLEIMGNNLLNVEAGYINSVDKLKQDLIIKVKLTEKDLATLIVVDAVKKNMDKYKENPDMYKAMLNAFVNEDYIEDNVQTIQNSEAFKNYVNELGGINEKGYINTKLLSNEILNGKAFDKYVSHQNKLAEIKNKEIAERKEAILKSKISEYNSLSPEKKEDFLKREFKLNRDFMEYRRHKKEGAVFESVLQGKYDLCYKFKLRADTEKLMSLDDPIEINNFLNEIGSTSKEGDIVDKGYIKEVEDNAKALDKKNKVEKKQELRMEEI